MTYRRNVLTDMHMKMRVRVPQRGPQPVPWLGRAGFNGCVRSPRRPTGLCGARISISRGRRLERGVLAGDQGSLPACRSSHPPNSPPAALPRADRRTADFHSPHQRPSGQVHSKAGQDDYDRQSQRSVRVQGWESELYKYAPVPTSFLKLPSAT